MIDSYKKGNQPDLDFSPPDGSFDLTLVDKGKDGKDGQASGNGFNYNPQLVKPNYEVDDEPTDDVYKEYFS